MRRSRSKGDALTSRASPERRKISLLGLAQKKKKKKNREDPLAREQGAARQALSFTVSAAVLMPRKLKSGEEGKSKANS